MTGGSLGQRTSSYGSLQQQQQLQNSVALLPIQTTPVPRKQGKMLLSASREKERFLHRICKFAGRRRVGMLLLVVVSVVVFMSVLSAVNKGLTLYLFLCPFSFTAILTLVYNFLLIIVGIRCGLRLVLFFQLRTSIKDYNDEKLVFIELTMTELFQSYKKNSQTMCTTVTNSSLFLPVWPILLTCGREMAMRP